MSARQLLFLGTMCYALLVVFGSLVPFEYHPLSLASQWEQFTEVLRQPLSIKSRSDFLANILLFLPLSFLFAGAVTLGTGKRYWWCLPFVALLCVAFGSAIEFIQLTFSGRSSSLSDIVAQSLGSCLGVLLWMVIGQTTIQLAMNGDKRLSQSHPLLYLLPYYLLLVIVLETAPFDFTISPVEVVHKYREGRIGLVPLAAFADDARNMPIKTFWVFLQLLPVGLALGHIQHLPGWKALLLGLGISLLLEMMQLLVISRFFEPTDILTGTAAVFTGWLIVRRQLQLEHRTLARPANVTLLTFCLLALCLINWSPFNFTLAVGQQQFTQMSFIPFADYQQKNYLAAFDDISHKVLLFALLGAVLTACFSGLRMAGTILITTLFALIVEVGQFWLPGRYPSLTDVVLACGASVLGYFCVRGATPAAFSTPSRVQLCPI